MGKVLYEGPLTYIVLNIVTINFKGSSKQLKLNKIEKIYLKILKSIFQSCFHPFCYEDNSNKHGNEFWLNENFCKLISFPVENL